MTPIHIITVTGRVQGVFYRVTASQVAKELGIIGFVQNLASGEVYIEAQGSKQNIDKFIAWCRTGSKYSQVEDVHIKKAPSFSRVVESDFEIY